MAASCLSKPGRREHCSLSQMDALRFSPILLLQIGGGQNIHSKLLKVAIGVIEESRVLRVQPFNEYRKRFGMQPYTSFQELTGNDGTLEEILWNRRTFFPEISQST